MKTLISIPRQALADLLAAAGSTLTPEQYVASLPEVTAFRKFPGRARVAGWSKPVLLLVAVLSGIFFGFFPGIENAIIVIGLCVVTFFEYRVHRYFLEENPEAPSLGFRNQACFAGAILIYCLYHGFSTFHMPPEAQVMVEQNNVIDPAMLTSLVRVFYLFVAVTAGGSQFALACYYRSAKD